MPVYKVIYLCAAHTELLNYSYQLQPMKELERLLEKRIRCQVSIDNMQFGFMPGKGTTVAIFIM